MNGLVIGILEKRADVQVPEGERGGPPLQKSPAFSVSRLQNSGYTLRFNEVFSFSSTILHNCCDTTRSLSQTEERIILPSLLSV